MKYLDIFPQKVGIPFGSAEVSLHRRPHDERRHPLPAEDLDGLVLAEHVAIRDAALRKRLQRVLVDEEVLTANNRLEAEPNKFTYTLSLPDCFKDVTLKPLARFMHRYIVYGVLYDWYTELGLLQQASPYGQQMTLMEEEIAGALKGPSIQWKPPQPFGPAQKMPL